MRTERYFSFLTHVVTGSVSKKKPPLTQSQYRLGMREAALLHTEQQQKQDT